MADAMKEYVTKYKTKKETRDNSTNAKKRRLAFLMSGVHGSGKSNLATAGDKRTPGQRLYQIG